MNSLTTTPLLAALLLGAAATLLPAQEPPQMPPPAKEHEWLNKFLGEWENETEIFMEPGKPPLKAKGTETVRSLGGFWIISDGQGEMMGQAMKHHLILGYDVARKKYTGTWIDSMNGHLWVYEGTVDAGGNILTLETEGTCPMIPGRLRKFKEVTEFQGPNRRVFTSSLLDDDGKWLEIVRVTATRKE